MSNTAHRQMALMITALSPISHGDTRTGVDNATNTRLFMTQAALVRGRTTYLPHLSENALRTVLFRAPLADHMLATLGIERGQLSAPMLSLLYAGGNRAGGVKEAADPMGAGHRVKKLYPILDLLGGSLDAMILPRSRMRLTCWLAHRQNADLIPPAFSLDRSNLPDAHDLIGREVRTRGTGAEASGNQMIYEYEVLASGARACLLITLDPWTPDATAAAIGAALEAWDGYIGGQARQGRGHVRLEGEWPAPDAYLDHLRANGDRMREGLLDGSLGEVLRMVG